MRYQHWKSTGQYFDYKGHSIFFQVAGSGDPLLLIHGFPTASWDWHKVWSALTERYQVFVPDLIGFGFSDKPKKYKYSIHDQADLIASFMAEMGIPKFHVLAHDYGNSVAQELLARHLEQKDKADTNIRIPSLCFLNGGLFPEMHRKRFIQTLLISPIGFLVSKLSNKNTLKKNFHNVFGEKSPPTDDEIDEFWDLIQYNDGAAIMHKLIRYISDRKAHRSRWVGALFDADIPIRLIDGPQDPVSGRHLAEYYLEKIPNPDVVLLEGVGHYPQTEDPENVLKYYFEFRDKIKHP